VALAQEFGGEADRLALVLGGEALPEVVVADGQGIAAAFYLDDGTGGGGIHGRAAFGQKGCGEKQGCKEHGLPR
jgi:hypothetical protein